MTRASTASQLIRLADQLSDSLEAIDYSSVASWVYNPFRYASKPYAEYLKRFAKGPVRIVYIGMNPGPWGMAQTGIPFGEVAAVRDWLQIKSQANQPDRIHPKRPIQGLQCDRSEVSGKRLWGLFREKFGSPEQFFEDQFVMNYCPLAFMDDGAKNLTPDKFPIDVRKAIEQPCDLHLRSALELLQPKWVVGVGGFAEECAKRVLEGYSSKNKPIVLRILHPSPASPAANQDWSGKVTNTLLEAGVW